MSPTCWAFAYATELSLSTLSARAALIGAATFALIRDIAARSGSGSPAMASSSSRVRRLYFSVTTAPFSGELRGLADRGVLNGVRVGDRPIGQDVRRDRRIHRNGEIRVDERHRRALRQRLPCQLCELAAGQHLVLLCLSHGLLLSQSLTHCETLMSYRSEG